MLEYIFDGGILMYPLILLSVVGLAVMIDRACAFHAAARDVDELKKSVMDAVTEGRFDDAEEACVSTGGPVAAVLLVGISKFRKLAGSGRTPGEISDIVRKSMENYAPVAIGTLERNVGILPVVASLGPLVGMTGTVTGMIGSFNAMSQATTLEATTVSAGISEALITTAAGLLIAMPSVIAYNIFSRKVDAAVQEMDLVCTGLADYIALDFKAEEK